MLRRVDSTVKIILREKYFCINAGAPKSVTSGDREGVEQQTKVKPWQAPRRWTVGSRQEQRAQGAGGRHPPDSHARCGCRHRRPAADGTKRCACGGAAGGGGSSAERGGVHSQTWKRVGRMSCTVMWSHAAVDTHSALGSAGGESGGKRHLLTAVGYTALACKRTTDSLCTSTPQQAGLTLVKSWPAAPAMGCMAASGRPPSSSQ